MAYGEYAAMRYARRHARFHHHHHDGSQRHGSGRAYRQQRQREHLTVFDLIALALATRRASHSVAIAPPPAAVYDAARVRSPAHLRTQLTRIRQRRGLVGRVVEADAHPPALEQTPHVAPAPPHVTPDWRTRRVALIAQDTRMRARGHTRGDTRAGTRGDSGRTTTTNDLWGVPIVVDEPPTEDPGRPSSVLPVPRAQTPLGRPDLADDLLSGLTALGYRAREVKPLVRDLCASAPADTTIEQALTRALRLLNTRSS